MFSNKDLRRLIVPLFLEQLLVILVGLADTFVISFAGEAAVSGVSLAFLATTIGAKGDMNLGDDKAFLIRVISQYLTYIGYPRSLNAVNCVNKAAEEMA